MENIVDIQTKLELYRAEGRKAIHKPGMSVSDFKSKQTELQVEEHHRADALEKFMRAVPIPKPSRNHTAHHIVPGKGKTQYAYRARVRIHLFGVRINDPDNGVWLPTLGIRRTGPCRNHWDTCNTTLKDMSVGWRRN